MIRNGQRTKMIPCESIKILCFAFTRDHFRASPITHEIFLLYDISLSVLSRGCRIMYVITRIADVTWTCWRRCSFQICTCIWLRNTTLIYYKAMPWKRNIHFGFVFAWNQPIWHSEVLFNIHFFQDLYWVDFRSHKWEWPWKGLRRILCLHLVLKI